MDLGTSAFLGVIGAGTGVADRFHFVAVDHLAPADAACATAGTIVPVVPAGRAPRTTSSHAHGLLAVSVRELGDVAAVGDLHPDFLLLQPELTDRCRGDDADAAIVAAVVAYARARSIELVATGITDQLQLDRLRDLGLRYGAGPHVDRRTGLGLDLADARTPQERSSRLRSRLDALRTAVDVAEAVCDHVRDLGLLPSVYVERNGLLRCLAQRGYWQVMDGIPVELGVIGRVFRTGRAEVVDVGADDSFIEAVPDLVAEIAVPIVVAGATRGVFSVESARRFRPEELHEVERIADELQRAMRRVGVEADDSPLHCLARASAELVIAADEDGLAHSAVRLACEVAGTSSAMVAHPGDGGVLEVRAAVGPLAVALRSLDPALLVGLAADLGGISSCRAGGDDDGTVRAAFRPLRAAGGTSLGVFPVTTGGTRPGLLFVADRTPGGLDGERCEAMELLAAAVGRTLERVRLVATLRTRAEQDPLTLVGNRSAFDVAVSRLESLDAGLAPLAVLLVDLDRFKQINDRFGHLVGDQVLADTARSMADCLRSGDQLFRIGGDEFAVLAPDLGPGEAVDLAGRLTARAARALADFDASMSVGVAVRQAGEAVSACLHRADRHLYEVKRRATVDR